ncbi:helicase C-terminal domain-containing protein [Paraclostridium bifermentans]|uniref:helicase C-terminal domain-containing protein n=1 Tax=Paraclostridium bifermentans TaxID=1490 RepID=UPI0029090EA9|nr:helicase C-terminal domain-containing protein [Paraclostridium bifermentans]MDU3803956.1 helicase C-terminal domain-containing protein [Paraclostridium bifermentans]
MKSILNDVVYLNIVTSGLNPNTSEIIEIAAIKVINNEVFKFNTLIKPYDEVPVSVFGTCKNLKQNDLDKAPTIYQIRNKFIDFIKDYPIICHDLKSKKCFLDKYVFKNKRFKNELLDSMQLAIILEPFHINYELNYLINKVTDINKQVNNRALNDVLLNIQLVNALLIRLWKSEETRLDKLYFNLEQYFKSSNIKSWEWIKYLKEIDEKNEFEQSVLFEINEKDSQGNRHNVNLSKYKNSYEDLLKLNELWTNSKNFSYIFRPKQHEFTKFIKDVFNSKEDAPKIGCIEAPTGIGKSVGYLIPAIMESFYNGKKIVISTDTKNLQMQLINKDIPTVLKSLNLQSKINYGCMKGKNNYLCNRRLEEYKKSVVFKSQSELLEFLYIQRLIENGEYGDIEEIPNNVKYIFSEIEGLILNLRCESDICYPEKCIERCFYKNRIKELKKEHITVINHSLLAKWPYKEQKQLDYLIIDEGHNLMEKSYDFFTSECNSILLDKLLDELYPHSEINHKNVSTMDKFYISVAGKLQLDSNIKAKLQEKTTLAKQSINNILNGCGKSLKSGLYDHSWEINRQRAPLSNVSFKNRVDISGYMRSEFENIVIYLKEILRSLNYIIDQCEKEGEDDSYIFNTISAKTMDIDCNILTIESFIEKKLDNYCRIIDINNEYKYFNIRVIPIDVAEMFESMFLSTVNTVVFLSATLNINNNMSTFKRILGLDKHKTIEKTIESIYDYKGKTKILAMEEFPKYNALNDEFIDHTVKLIENICVNSNGHVLALFTSKNRLEKVYKKLVHRLNIHNIELYKDKSAVNNLRDLSKKCVVLASKSCFEGVDIQGEGLTCVILDKLPNKSLDDPLYSSIRSFKRTTYDDVNYPQLSIKAKQAYGRLIRSKYDYGYFIILDIGHNNTTINKLKRDLHDCDIKRVNTDYVIDSISKDFKRWKLETFREILKDIKCDIYSPMKIIYKNNNEMNRIDYINEEVSKRNIALYIKDIDIKNKKLKISYK